MAQRKSLIYKDATLTLYGSYTQLLVQIL